MNQAELKDPLLMDKFLEDNTLNKLNISFLLSQIAWNIDPVLLYGNEVCVVRSFASKFL